MSEYMRAVSKLESAQQAKLEVLKRKLGDAVDQINDGENAVREGKQREKEAREQIANLLGLGVWDISEHSWEILD